MSESALSEQAADDVYSVLVDKCGASERRRAHFIHAQTSERVVEWRFQGALGFGGKFWRNTGRRADGSWGEVWYVNCYPEDETAELVATIKAANRSLDALRRAHTWLAS